MKRGNKNDHKLRAKTSKRGTKARLKGTNTIQESVTFERDIDNEKQNDPERNPENQASG